MASVLVSLTSLASTNSLPQIRDATTLRKDCVALYQSFSLTNQSPEASIKIPKEKWTAAMVALKPFDVDKDNFGIAIWIIRQSPIRENWIAKGYFISCSTNTESPPSAGTLRGRFIFNKTEQEKIYQFEQPIAVR
jgi:hypothetical protein